MDFKKTFHKLLKVNFFIKYAPNAVRAAGEKAMNLHCVTYLYNFLARHNDVSETERENARAYFNEAGLKIEENISWLADDLSKKTYANMLEYRCTHKNKPVREAAQKPKQQYRDAVVGFCSKEVFVDVGAFLGETTCGIYKIIRKSIGKGSVDFTSLLIEPDDFNFSVCRKNVLDAGFKAFAEKCAVGSTNKTEKFSGGIYGSSRISDSGEKTVKVTTIDSLCKKHGVEPTYIKYDVEGCEREALKGTHTTIERFRPRLAVSIYHSDEDMVEIIRDIRSRYPFYDFYIRHYSGFFADTILYCIPQK